MFNNTQKNTDDFISVIIKKTQQRGKLKGYNFEYLQSWMGQDSNAGNTIMPVILENGGVMQVPLKDLVILKAFTNNTEIAIQLVMKSPVKPSAHINNNIQTNQPPKINNPNIKHNPNIINLQKPFKSNNSGWF